MTIGERIKARRIELGMSVNDLAKRLGKNRATVYRYEDGFIENLPLEILEPLAEVLHTTPAHLMGWEEEKEEKPTAKDDELSENMKKLIDFAKGVPEDKVELVLKVMKSIVEAD